MLGVNHCGDTTFFLRLGYGMEGEGCLAGGFRTVYLNDAPAGKTTDTEGEVKAYRAGGYHLHRLYFFLTEFHYGTAAIILLDVVERLLEGLEARLFGVGSRNFLYRCFFCHCVFFYF